MHRGRPLQFWVRQKVCPTNLSSNIFHVSLKFKDFCINRQFIWFLIKLLLNSQTFSLKFGLFSSSIFAKFDHSHSNTIYSPTPGTSMDVPDVPAPSPLLGRAMGGSNQEGRGKGWSEQSGLLYWNNQEGKGKGWSEQSGQVERNNPDRGNWNLRSLGVSALRREFRFSLLKTLHFTLNAKTLNVLNPPRAWNHKWRRLRNCGPEMSQKVWLM